jgi:N-terminal domain of (some) glycogen debranching enzymes
MPVEISVGPPVLTISYGSSFMVTDLNGEIAAESEQGVFAGDTRFLSYYALFANGEPWVRLSSSTISSFGARIYLTNPQITTEAGEIREGTLALTVSRAVGEGIHEDLDLTNYGLHPVRFMLEVAIRSDFADLFEVRQHRFVRRGRIDTEVIGVGSVCARGNQGRTCAPQRASGNGVQLNPLVDPHELGLSPR